MTDPRLNSIHLEMPRRQAFRSAREALLSARGYQTVAVEAPAQPDRSLDQPNTFIQNAAARPLPDLQFMLVDRDYVYPLKLGVNTIGRLPDNDIVINDAHVSRRHCAILVHTDLHCELHDVASKNGTFVNGRRLEGPTRLHTGDEIRMCDRPVVFMSKGEEPPPLANTATQGG
jgi:hypothetical protein